MKRTTLFLLAAMIVPFCHGLIYGQEVKRIHAVAVPSLSGRDSIQMGIMLPPSYGKKGGNYPVIYYLHGLRDHYAGPKAIGMANWFSDRFSEELLPECIVVFPDGEEGFWGDHADGDPLLETEIISGLVPFMDLNYSTDPSRRLIMGWSAGGLGSLNFFFKYPELFQGAIALDGSLVNWEEFQQFQGERPGIAKDSAYYNDYFYPERYIAENQTALRQKQDTALLLVASFFTPMYQRMNAFLQDFGIPYKYMELHCAHDFSCIFGATEKVLTDFLSKNLD